MNLRSTGITLFDRWTALWNGELSLAADIMASTFRLRYAQPGTQAFDECRTPAQIARLIGGWRQGRPGLVFRADGDAAVDLTLIEGQPYGLVVRPYVATLAKEPGEAMRKSGIDMLRVQAGRIAEVWSVSAERTFYP
jgi:hypothetical protein